MRMSMPRIGLPLQRLAQCASAIVLVGAMLSGCQTRQILQQDLQQSVAQAQQQAAQQKSEITNRVLNTPLNSPLPDISASTAPSSAIEQRVTVDYQCDAGVQLSIRYRVDQQKQRRPEFLFWQGQQRRLVNEGGGRELASTENSALSWNLTDRRGLLVERTTGKIKAKNCLALAD